MRSFLIVRVNIGVAWEQTRDLFNWGFEVHPQIMFSDNNKKIQKISRVLYILI